VPAAPLASRSQRRIIGATGARSSEIDGANRGLPRLSEVVHIRASRVGLRRFRALLNNQVPEADRRTSPLRRLFPLAH
jgi:hypothetical protein